MANKRTLKKQIKYVCGDIAGECVMATYFVEGLDVEKMQDVILEVATLQSVTLKRVTFSYDKVTSDFESKQAYFIARSKYFKQAYNTLRADFDQKIQDIVKSMNLLLPQAQKEENKKIVNQ